MALIYFVCAQIIIQNTPDDGSGKKKAAKKSAEERKPAKKASDEKPAAKKSSNKPEPQPA